MAEQGPQTVFLVNMAARFFGAREQERFVSVLPQVMHTARSIPGFIYVDFWRSVLDPRLLLEESYWASREAAQQWRANPFHMELQKLGYETLITENTTTWWEATGKAHLFLKCPVCSHVDRSDHEMAEAIARPKPLACSRCGFIYPSVPIIEPGERPVWQTLPGGMDVIK